MKRSASKQTSESSFRLESRLEGYWKTNLGITHNTHKDTTKHARTSDWWPLRVRILSKWSVSQCLMVLSLEQVNR